MTFLWISATVLQSKVWSISHLTVHCWFDPRGQLVYRLAHGPTEVAQSLPIHSPTQRSADIGAGQPKVNVILVVNYSVLDEREWDVRHRRIGGNVP